MAGASSYKYRADLFGKHPACALCRDGVRGNAPLAKVPFPLAPERALSIARGVADGLAYAHENGIVHRDIKPDNILLTPDSVPKIIDWGLAKDLSDTRKTSIAGFSPEYAAPEQLDRATWGNPGSRTDIYQLGVMLYEMLAGKTPFAGEGLGEIIRAILHDPPRGLKGEIPCPSAIRTIIRKGLQKHPEDRYRTAEELIADLDAAKKSLLPV